MTSAPRDRRQLTTHEAQEGQAQEGQEEQRPERPRPMTEAQAHALARAIVRAHPQTWTAFAILARDMLTWHEPPSWIVIATSRQPDQTERTYILEHPEMWPSIRARHEIH